MLSYNELKDQRIAVLLSGGVDSAVVVSQLARMGLTPDCFYIKIGPEEEKEWNCSAEEDVEMATVVARRYGCRLEVVDCHREYWDQVTRYTMEKVRAGYTPNPDVMCNRLIKFGAFHEKRGHAYDLIATGHYAQTEMDAEGRKWLVTCPDPVKDQTDFLSQLSYSQLSHTIFPIGHLMKEEVRRIALEARLPSAHRKDSQGICFLGKINYNDFLRKFLGEKEGKVIDIETGKVVGTHQGFWFHTIGQRKGLGLGGGPWFVVKKNIRKNIVFVAHGWDTQLQYGHDFRLADMHFITKNPWTNPRQVPVCFKIRHVGSFMQGTLTLDAEGYHIHSETPIQGIAPGQFGCIYDASARICYGSGEISIFRKR